VKPPLLRDVQVWTVGAITGADTDADADTVARFVTAGPRLTATERFEIYRSGYHARLVECLLDDYPVLAAMLDNESEGQFAALCRGSVDRHPSASPNLNGFGRHMASFCREAKVEGFPGFQALARCAADLAALEWALVEVLHAETAPPLDIAALQALPPEAWASARFVRSEGLRLLRFEYPVNALFTRNRLEDVIPDVPAPSPTAVAVYRKDMQLWRMDLTPAMLGVLDPLVAGKSLGEALEVVEAECTDPDVLAQTGANLMVWFREWVDAGFFTRIVVD
jgi:hypothetical protein